MARASRCFANITSLVLAAQAWKSPVHQCCVGQTLRIAMGPDTFSPYIIYNGVPMSGSQEPIESSYTGFIPDVLDELSKEMGFRYEYLTRPPAEMHHQSGTIAALTQMANRSYDAVGVFLDNPELSRHGDFVLSCPILSASNLALVGKKVQERGTWNVFRPFAIDTWLAVMGGLLGFLLITVAINAESKGLREASDLGTICSAYYHIWSALFGQDDNTWESFPMRLLRLGLLFFSLVVMSTYTASLASWLVMPDILIHGPKNMADLLGAHATYHDPSYAFTIEPFVGKLTLPEAGESLEAKLEWMLKLLKEGKVDVLIANDSPVMDLWLQNCADTQIVPSITFSPWYWAFALRSDEVGLKFARDITIAMSRFVSTSTYQALEARWLNRGKTCPSSVSTASAIEAKDIQGTFIIAFTVGICAALASLSRRCLMRMQVVDEVDFIEPDAETPIENFQCVIGRVNCEQRDS
eukprot:TRINITY_DN18093_c0_g1_i7.p1 TRINITY_DN18093_c0_g1~~TRINITY_DN18093_c0_g1_i7.p1  ORF type:complete len:468 (+),score=61.71 TRINITY_DN18093_c0_g1_i7:75-1478(+)